MTECEFSVIKYVPDIVRFEPVNVGIALLDKENKKMHNKYIRNFSAFFDRLGVEKINGFEHSFENYKSIVNVDNSDYLWKLHDSFQGSMFYSEPTKIKSDTIDATLQQIFNKMISIPEKEISVKEQISVNVIKTKIKRHITKLKFPEKSYKERYEIIPETKIPQTRDFAFLKEDELINTIDIFTFSSTGLLDNLKLFLYEIDAIMKSKISQNNQPLIFSTKPINAYEKSRSVHQSIEYLHMSKISIIYPDKQEEMIQKIRNNIAV